MGPKWSPILVLIAVNLDCLSSLIWPFNLTALSFELCMYCANVSHYKDGWAVNFNRIPNLNTSIRAQHKHESTIRKVRVNGQITEVKEPRPRLILRWVEILNPSISLWPWLAEILGKLGKFYCSVGFAITEFKHNGFFRNSNLANWMWWIHRLKLFLSEYLIYSIKYIDLCKIHSMN